MNIFRNIINNIIRFFTNIWRGKREDKAIGQPVKEDEFQDRNLTETASDVPERVVSNQKDDKIDKKTESIIDYSPRKMNFLKEYIFLGLDFGTSKTAIAAYRGKINKSLYPSQMPISLRIGEDGATNYMPSTVSFNPAKKGAENSYMIGEIAERMETGIRVHSIKRCLICDGTLCEQNKRKPYPWCKGDRKVHINAQTIFSPEYIARMIIEEAINRAKAALSTTTWAGSDKELVIDISKMGCGATFNLPYRKMLVDIVKDLGYENIKIIDVVEEPVLAGLANIRYLSDQVGRFLVYDFGGGTFDSAIIEVENYDNHPKITILSTVGDEWLGGDDIDNLISELFIAKYAQKIGKEPLGVHDKLTNLDKNNLRYRAKKAKELLTDELEFSDALFSTSGIIIPLEINRGELNQLLNNNKILKRSIDATMIACKQSHAFDKLLVQDTLNPRDTSELQPLEFAEILKKVLLVGGVSKIPLIKDYLSTNFGEEKTTVKTYIDPVTSVSIGASINDNNSNFSVNCLPYGFKIIGKKDGNNKDTIIILEPYTYLNYFKFTFTYGWYCFEKSFYLDYDLGFVDLFEFFPNGDIKRVDTDLGNMNAGLWKILINIKGKIFLRGPNNRKDEIGYLLDLHPVQKQIIFNEQKRIKERISDIPMNGNEGIEKGGWYDD